MKKILTDFLEDLKQAGINISGDEGITSKLISEFGDKDNAVSGSGFSIVLAQLRGFGVEAKRPPGSTEAISNHLTKLGYSTDVTAQILANIRM